MKTENNVENECKDMLIVQSFIDNQAELDKHTWGNHVCTLKVSLKKTRLFFMENRWLRIE